MSSNDLMLAILAMDSYNRGYDAGRFEDRVRRRSMPRFSATEPWPYRPRRARNGQHAPRCEYPLIIGANAQRACVCAEDALLAADDGTAAVWMLRYIETGGKRRTFRRPASRHDGGRDAFGAWTAKSQPGRQVVCLAGVILGVTA
jgi:hypothetical protein